MDLFPFTRVLRGHSPLPSLVLPPSVRRLRCPRLQVSVSSEPHKPIEVRQVTETLRSTSRPPSVDTDVRSVPVRSLLEHPFRPTNLNWDTPTPYSSELPVTRPCTTSSDSQVVGTRNRNPRVTETEKQKYRRSPRSEFLNSEVQLLFVSLFKSSL